MKRNGLRRIAALAASIAVLATSGVVSAITAGAVDFDIADVSVDAAKVGENVEVSVNIADNSYGFTSCGVMLTFDSKLKYVSYSAGADCKLTVKCTPSSNRVYIQSFGPDADVFDVNGVLAKLTFSLPADAKAGDKYEIKWTSTEPRDLTNATFGDDEAGKKNAADLLASYKPIDGYILISGGTPTETTPSETTPSETTPSETTPSETTPSETTPSETTPSETTPSETTPSETTPSETTPSETTPSETTPEQPKFNVVDPTWGDANEDGKVSMIDVVKIRQYASGLKAALPTEQALLNANVKYDSEINVDDANEVQSFVAELYDVIGPYNEKDGDDAEKATWEASEIYAFLNKK